MPRAAVAPGRGVLPWSRSPHDPSREIPLPRSALLLALVGSALAALPARPQAMPRHAPPDLMAPGVTVELARHRAATLGETRYALELDLTGGDRAPGRVVLTFERAAGAGDLVLDFRGTALGPVVVNGVAVDDVEWRNGHVRVGEAWLRAGENTLSATFSTPIAASGASIIRFIDPADGAEYLYTLLVPADASQLFPSLDQPDLKARIRLVLVAPADWDVVANTPGEVVRQNGAALWSFEETLPISTYLLAFAAGPWRRWSAPSGERSMRLFARSGLADEVDADTLMRLNLRSVDWLEDYFGIPYPFGKLDVVLAPAFPFGGMEHVGAIFYNENQFVFREAPTTAQRLGRASTVFHEVAHQWFGDLVTMTWFDDLWLKEGFATYMAARMQADLLPGADAWLAFHLRNKPPAYAVDATRGTTPVWQALANLDLAKSNYGPIVYNKAPAILKQLEFLVGVEGFRAGVSLFLRRHAFGNAGWRDLLAAVEEATGVSLAAFGEAYILRPGMPRVETLLDVRRGRVAALELRQRPARPEVSGEGAWWPGRVLVRLGYRDREDVVLAVELSGPVTRVREAEGLPAPDWVWSNDGDHGYGLFLLDPASAAWVAEHVGAEPDPLRRAMLWGALWEEVREGRMDPLAFARAVLREVDAEADDQIAAMLLGRAWMALSHYQDPARAAPLLPAWEALLAARADSSRLGYPARKASLDLLVASATTPAGRARLRGLLAGTHLLDGEAVRQPTRWSIVERLVALGEPDGAELVAAEALRDETPDADRRAFIAGAGLPQREAKARHFARMLGDPALNEEWATASLAAFNAPGQGELTLPYLLPALERLEWIREHRRIFFLPRWLASFVGGQTSTAALGVVDAWLADLPDLAPDLRLKVLQQRDELERTVRLRAAWR
jgi:aminopeptidase N